MKKQSLQEKIEEIIEKCVREYRECVDKRVVTEGETKKYLEKEIFSLIHQEVIACIPKKMTLKRANKFWMAFDTDSPYIDMQIFYNQALSDIRTKLKEKGLI